MKLASCVAAAIWVSSGSAWAQPRAAGPDVIQLDIVDCAQVSGTRVREIVAIELAPRRVLGVGSADPAATHASLSCRAGIAQISVDHTKLTAPLWLEIALQDLDPPARSRLVALAIAELITTSKLQGGKPPAGVVSSSATPKGVAASGEARATGSHEAAPRDSAARTLDATSSVDPRGPGASANKSAPRAPANSETGAARSGEAAADASGEGVGRVEGAVHGESAGVGRGEGAAESGEVSRFVRDEHVGAVSDEGPDVDAYDAVGGGGQLGAQVWLGVGAARIAEPSMIAPAAAAGVSVNWRALALNADLRFEHAQSSRSVAELQLDAGSLALVPAWRLHSRSADVSIGPGVRVGYASMRATPHDAAFRGQTLHGFWLGPCAQLALQLRFADRWAVRLGAELAYITRTLRGIDSNGSAVLALRDLALAAQLGISWDAIAAR
jgi:hypothetical protein